MTYSWDDDFWDDMFEGDPFDIGGEALEEIKNDAAKAVYKNGMCCKKCRELFPYAEPNQKDGSLICYKCRHGL